jgi:cysteine desulfurase / selenocysteine lyase
VNALSDIRKQFPILSQTVNGRPLVYLDNAATTQKPERVLAAMDDFYHTANSNIHRGVHALSRKATAMYEEARTVISRHFNLDDPQQAIFTAGTTDSINMVAQALSQGHVREGDEIIVSTYEHHSNMLPWQLLARQCGAKLLPLALTDSQSLDLDALKKQISGKTRLIAIAHVSNTLGVISDLKAIKKLIGDRNIAIFVDGAQSAPHLPVDLKELAVDFFACSAHKMYGPTGTGLLCLSPRWLKELPVSRPGGGTITTVSFESTVFAEGALRFEPGTPNIAGAIGFAEAVRFMDDIGMMVIHDHELSLMRKAQASSSTVNRRTRQA